MLLHQVTILTWQQMTAASNRVLQSRPWTSTVGCIATAYLTSIQHAGGAALAVAVQGEASWAAHPTLTNNARLVTVACCVCCTAAASRGHLAYSSMLQGGCSMLCEWFEAIQLEGYWMTTHTGMPTVPEV